MPDKCCIPYCKSNYQSEKENVSVFRFPKEERLRESWLKNIPRKNWIPGKRAVVCEKHFEQTFISKEESYKDENGVERSFPRKRPILLPQAIPTLFPNLPKYLSKSLTTIRQDPETKRQALIKQQEEKTEEWLQRDIILNYETFRQLFKNKINIINWKHEIYSNKIILYKVDFTDLPKVQVCIEINNDLSVKVFKSSSFMDPKDLDWILDNGKKLKRWSQIENILSRYGNEIVDNACLSSLIAAVNIHLQRLQSFLSNNDNENENDNEKVSKLNFIIEQFKLLFMEKHALQYSIHMILCSFLIYTQSCNCYSALRKNAILTLPHPRTLQRLSSSTHVAIDKSNENEHFLRSLASKLNEKEKYVILQIDEIYIKQNIEYKNGSLSGFAHNDTTSAARTVVAFMICSAFGSFKEIVSLIPLNNVNGNELTSYTKEVCKLVTACDYKIIAIITDNNRVNRVMFQQLSSFDNNFTHQLSNTFKTFLTYDSVHIFKNIRNNWLCQKDAEKSFVFPSFYEHDKILVAKFSDIRQLYNKEYNQLIKLAPKLNFKTVFPSTLDRQKVSLVNNVFHESTLAAVHQEYGFESGTAKFLEIILKWWTIVNIKNSLKSVLHRNLLEAAFTDENDGRIIFLNDFFLMTSWLTSWKALNLNHGILTTDTFIRM